MAILYADDVEEDLKYWSRVLVRKGYSVTPAPTYEEAERQLRKGGFELAILDLMLRGQNQGPWGLHLAHEYGRKVPMIFLTAHGSLNDANQALQEHAFHCVAKVDGQQPLLQAVADTLKRRVFVVHGHDSRSLGEVVDFLKARRLWPIVLAEEAAKGRTIIEKFEGSSNVGFAVVLFTPDDLGGTQVRPGEPDTLRQRPRQNVVFELGYFIGKLGRANTVVLCDDREAIEILSDYAGIEVIAKRSSINWRDDLADEMKAAGVPIP